MTNFSQLSSHLISFEAHLYATPRHFRCALLPFLLCSILALFHTSKAYHRGHHESIVNSNFIRLLFQLQLRDEFATTVSPGAPSAERISISEI